MKRAFLFGVGCSLICIGLGIVVHGLADQLDPRFGLDPFSRELLPFEGTPRWAFIAVGLVVWLLSVIVFRAASHHVSFPKWFGWWLLSPRLVAIIGWVLGLFTPLLVVGVSMELAGLHGLSVRGSSGRSQPSAQLAAEQPQTLPFADELFPQWIDDVRIANEQRDYAKALSLLMSHIADPTVGAGQHRYSPGGHAQYMVGLMFEKGEGVLQDFVRAHMWFNLAAAQGDALAVEKRDNLARRMTPAQIAEAQKLAREWRSTTRP